MIDYSSSEVYESLYQLSQKIDNVKNVLKRRLEKLVQVEDMKEAKQILEEISTLNEVKEILHSALEKFSTLPKLHVRPDTPRRKLASHEEEKRTPENAYRVPILESIEELGGSAPVADILTRVERKMRHILKNIDYERLDSGDIRWRNTARWCRNTMIMEGLLRNDSPHGVWEITEAGKAYLRRIKKSY